MTKSKFGLRNWFSSSLSNYRPPKANKHAKSKDKPEKAVEFYPKLPHGEDHPMPFYHSAELTFAPVRDPPWKANDDRLAKEKLDVVLNDPKIHKEFQTKLLEETVKEEVTNIVSMVLSEGKNKRSRDENAITLLEEGVLMPTVQSEVFQCCWELMFQCGRELTDEQFKELKKNEKELKMTDEDVEKLTIYGITPDEPSNGPFHQLSQHKWSQLLFNYRKKLEGKTFAESYAMKFVQDRILHQISTLQVAKDSITLAEKDMIMTDEVEKVKDPPRRG